jgi:hypothetical protein
MFLLALAPFFLQALTIGIDEIYFHHKRGLPKWERIGHPLDTLTVLFCMYMVIFIPVSPIAIKSYIALACFSCLFVTKDEFVHKHFCPAAENWLHALLFTVHPITLTMVGIIWVGISDYKTYSWIKNWLTNTAFLKQFLLIQAIMMTIFFLYQVIYWNFLWKEKIAIKN